MIDDDDASAQASAIIFSKRKWHRYMLLLLVCFLFSRTTYSKDGDLPRNQIPEVFHPHRAKFTCKNELTIAPLLNSQADIWYQEALALDTPDLWKDDRNWPLIIGLYTKAAERKHWKAMNNLATLYQTGVWGLKDSNKVLVPRNPEAAMTLTENAMRMGIPLAYAVMGNYYADGFIVKKNPTAAWAFWQKAADMGSSFAQFTVGRSLNAVLEKDEPERERWSNEVIGLKMLECAFAQGNGDAAEALGIEYDVIQKDKSRALHYFHEGVKFGSAASADYLRGEFQKVGGLAPAGVDNSRADRYRVFKKALEHDSDLRFPNLDNVLPLPPAKLPQWSGKPEDLINAAKEIHPVPPKPATNAAS
jgi:TPR repeat protein